MECILSMTVHRGQLIPSIEAFLLLEPILYSSLPVEQAIEGIGTLRNCDREGASEIFQDLVHQGFIALCSFPIQLREYNGVKAFIRREPVRVREDAWLMSSVQDSYFPDRINVDHAQTAVDIGGHLGSYTLFLKHRNPGMRIVAVEVEDQNAELLALNVSTLPGVFPYHAACTYSGDDFVLLKARDWSSWNMRVPANAIPTTLREGFNPLPPQKIQVPGITLEDIIKQHGFERINILKLDCEGCEYDVLMNASDHVLSRIDYIVGEIHCSWEEFEKRGGQRLREHFNFLEQRTEKQDLGMFCAENKAKPANTGPAIAVDRPVGSQSAQVAERSVEVLVALNKHHQYLRDAQTMADAEFKAPLTTVPGIGFLIRTLYRVLRLGRSQYKQSEVNTAAINEIGRLTDSVLTLHQMIGQQALELEQQKQVIAELSRKLDEVR
jgi:FkbM family methyltransferase